MLSPSLKEFADSIPVCQETASLATVIEVFRSWQCNAVVLVSEEQQPLGLISLPRLMPYLFWAAQPEVNPLLKAAEDLNKPLSQLLPSVIETLAIVPDQLSLSQFLSVLPDLDESESESQKLRELENLAKSTCSDPTTTKEKSNYLTQNWALVDSEGKFSGLLNSWLVLRAIASNCQTSNVEICSSVATKPTQFNSLVHLLEQLPLPLGLQNSAGETLAGNCSWHHLLSNSVDLKLISAPQNLTEPQSGNFERRKTSDDQQQEAKSLVSKTLVSPFLQSSPVEDVGDLNSQKATVSKSLPYSLPIEAPCCFGEQSADSNNNVLPSTYPGQEVEDFSNAPNFRKIPSSPSTNLAPTQLGRRKTNVTLTEAEVSAPQQLTVPQQRTVSFVKILLSPSLAQLYNSEEKELKEKQNRDCIPPIARDFSDELYLVLAQEKTQQQLFSQELLAKNAELVKLNRLKNEFLACISHELKTPITAVLGLSSLLKDQALGKLKDRQVRYAQLIYQNGRQLMTVVNDVLDLTRVETSQLELTPEPVQIDSICNQAHYQAQQRLYSKSEKLAESTAQTKFTLEVDSNLEIIVADKLRLCQMLVHLLENALQRTKDEGEIGLKVTLCEDWIDFTVWDTGDCISLEKQYNLLEQIPQSRETPTTRPEGIDLGLVLTQRLAHLHGGDISFISKTKNKNQFSLLLPTCQHQAVPVARKDRETSNFSNSALTFKNKPQGVSHSSSSLKNRLALLVETVPQYLENLTEQLDSLGYRVIIARSVGEAIDKARLFKPSVILLNPLLAEKRSSWEIIPFLKSDETTNHIPILVMATSTERQQAEGSSADGFLNLPVQKQVLRQSLIRLGLEQKDISRTLTILHLNPEAVEKNPNSSLLVSQLTDVVNCQNSEFNYRVLEADDLEQAEILARIWHPDIVLLAFTPLTEPLTYLKHFSSHETLKTLPLVTLDHQTTEAANQIKELCVYPCLAPDNQQKIAALLQVIQVAAGMSR